MIPGTAWWNTSANTQRILRRHQCALPVGDVHGFTTLPPAIGSFATACFLVFKEVLNKQPQACPRLRGARPCLSDRSGVEIVVADDGRGFELGKTGAGSRGNGLSNMRERIESLGGRFQIDTEPGKGTRVTIGIRLDARPKLPLYA